MARIEGSKFVIAGGLSQIGSEITRHLLQGGAREVVLFDNFALGTMDKMEASTLQSHGSRSFRLRDVN